MHGKKSLISLIGLLCLAIALVLAQVFAPSFKPLADTWGVAEPGCDLQQRPCLATLPSGERLELSITPRPIPLLKPLTLEVTLNGSAPQQIEVEFSGADMEMGIVRSVLAPVDAQHFRGETTLPVCVSGRMHWRVTVWLENRFGRIAIPFSFYSIA